MKCPNDGVDLVMADRQGVEIDYCPKCRGVWLDRGELDKIIERAPPVEAAAPQQPQPAPPPQAPYPAHAPYPPGRPYYEGGEGGEGGYYGHGHYGRRRRKSFLSDIFDF